MPLSKSRKSPFRQRRTRNSAVKIFVREGVLSNLPNTSLCGPQDERASVGGSNIDNVDPGAVLQGEELSQFEVLHCCQTTTFIFR